MSKGVNSGAESARLELGSHAVWSMVCEWVWSVGGLCNEGARVSARMRATRPRGRNMHPARVKTRA